MVEETFNIGTYDIDKEARYKIIKEWIGKIKAIRTSEVTDYWIVFIYLIIILLFPGLATFIIGLIVAFIFVPYIIKLKKPKRSEVLEEYPPNSIKFKCGLLEMSFPVTAEVQNANDKISIKYGISGLEVKKNINKLKEKLTTLTDDLEGMLKSQKHNENLNRANEIPKPSEEKAMPDINKFCPGCGRPNDRGLKFCAHCGTKLSANEMR